MTYKKNHITLTIILCIVLLGTVLTQNCFSNTPTEPNALQFADSWFNTDFKPATEEHIQQDLMKRFVYVILFVILLGFAAYYLTKKLLPKLTITQGKNITVIENIHLGPHKLLHIVQIGDSRRLLIGSTNENLNFLADITEDLPVTGPSTTPGKYAKHD